MTKIKSLGLIPGSKFLTRKELKNTFGGALNTTPIGLAGCSAKCPDTPSVVCGGKNCVAIDNVGCSSDEGTKSCPPPNVN